MREIVIQLPQGSPTLRRNAIPYRDNIFEAFKNPNIDKIVLDLAGIDIISGSFADECVGVLVGVYGLDAVTQKLRLRNGNGSAEKSIVRAMLDRASTPA